jgi:hypothetical protein
MVKNTRESNQENFTEAEIWIGDSYDEKTKLQMV